jgi:hypothetical protein
LALAIGFFAGSLIVFIVGIVMSRRTGKRLAQIDTLKQQMDPTPPVNIQIHLRDGRVIPVDSELNSIRMWRVIVPEWIDYGHIAEVTVDEMPPYSVLDVQALYKEHP